MAADRNPFEMPDFKGEVVAEYSGVTEEESDRLVLEELRSRGSDLSIPRHIVHHFYFDSVGERERAAAAVRPHGYKVSLPEMEQTEEGFLLRVERMGIANEMSIREDRAVLSGIAEEHAGVYDGWAASADN